MERLSKSLHKTDHKYPSQVQEIASPPEYLYCEGDINLLQGPCIAIVGTRKPTRLGRDLAFRFGKELADLGFVVASGLAYGIDAAAHQGALSVNGKTIAVLGAGLDIPYPQKNQSLRQQLNQNGLVITEFEEGTPALPGHFPRRNRIISGLSLGVLVVEAELKSGSLVTAKWAVEQNRDVFAIPGSLDSPMSIGPNTLIQRGAKLVQSVDDIVQEIPGYVAEKIQKLDTADKKPYTDLKDAERRVIEELGHEPTSVDEIVRRTKMESGELLATLLSMELQGLVQQHPGKRFTL